MSENDQFTGEMTETSFGSLDLLREGVQLAGRYTIEKVVGAGGMGVVYRAHDDELDTTVALKVLRAERRLDDAAIARFRQEILLSRKVSHPNVVRIHDIGQDGDSVFLTMDIVDGVTLNDELSRGPLDLARALAVARNLASGLAAAHDEGVIHRDLKPANVLIADGGRAWLTDFGIAQAVGANGMTAEGKIAGTPNYLSPEQVRGDDVNEKSDIFSFGVLLHEMLSGKVPLVGDTFTETAARRAAGAKVDTSKLTDIPSGVRRIVERCMEPNPDDRYSSAHALVDDLSRGRAQIAFRRNTIRGGIAAAALLVMVGVGWIFFNSIQRPGEAIPTINGTAVETIARVAILPFQNETGDQSLNWIERSLPQSLSSSLAEQPALQIVEALRVFRTIEALHPSSDSLSSGDVRQIASLLEADKVVMARLIGENGKYRLEIISHSFPGGDQKKRNVNIGEEGVLAAADNIVAQLEDEFSVAAVNRAPITNVSENIAAMNAYNNGIGDLATGESVKAVEALQSSVELDPAFGAGWTALATAYAEVGARQDAFAAASKAIDLLESDSRDGKLAQAQRAALGGDPDLSLALYEQISNDYPNDDEARVQYAVQLGEAGKFGEAINQLTEVVERDPNHPRGWYLLGRFAVLSGGAQKAIDEYLVRALLIQNRIGSAQGRADVFNTLGLAHDRLGELDIARQHYRNAAELRESAGDKRGFARSLANIARLDLIQGNLNSAREILNQSLTVMTETGNIADIAEIRNEFGVLEEEAGNYTGALENYREALRLRRQLGDSGHAESYVNLAFTYMVLGEFDNAAAFARDAKAEYVAASDRHGEMTVLEIEGELAIASGDWDAALQAYLAELEISKELGSPFAEAVANGGIGLVSHHQGRPTAAMNAYERSLEIIEPLDDQRGIMEFRLRRAAALIAIFNAEKALEEIAPLAEFAENSNVGQRAEYYRILACANAMNGNNAESRKYFGLAADAAEESKSKALILKIALWDAFYFAVSSSDVAKQLYEEAEKFGHRPSSLRARLMYAEALLRDRNYEEAAALARSSLTPPNGVENWIGNWRLNWVAWQADKNGGLDFDGDEFKVAASTDIAAMIDEISPELRSGLIGLAEESMLEIDAP